MEDYSCPQRLRSVISIGFDAACITASITRVGHTCLVKLLRSPLCHSQLPYLLEDPYAPLFRGESTRLFNMLSHPSLTSRASNQNASAKVRVYSIVPSFLTFFLVELCGFSTQRDCGSRLQTAGTDFFLSLHRKIRPRIPQRVSHRSKLVLYPTTGQCSYPNKKYTRIRSL